MEQNQTNMKMSTATMIDCPPHPKLCLALVCSLADSMCRHLHRCRIMAAAYDSDCINRSVRFVVQVSHEDTSAVSASSLNPITRVVQNAFQRQLYSSLEVDCLVAPAHYRLLPLLHTLLLSLPALPLLLASLRSLLRRRNPIRPWKTSSGSTHALMSRRRSNFSSDSK